MHQEEKESAIAVIGMSGRFPGANTVETFWNNLSQGKESIAAFSGDELGHSSIIPNQADIASYVKARGILSNVEQFDADFFSIPHAEAQVMDPQHRLFLECCWEALEDAAYVPERFPGTIGVFGGASRSTYFLHHLYPNLTISGVPEEYLVRIGNENDFLTTRVSYKLNLKGPSIAIQTACSTSLVSICVACNFLLSNQCDIALAGGVSIFSPQQSGYIYQKEMIFSPDGHCRPFDARAEGTVPGNGVGVVVLKRLEKALADRDFVYAIIRGYGINNDGREKIGFSAPSIQGQTDAIAAAIAMAKVDPATIGYVETHGTGTLIGDPIEIRALSKAYFPSGASGKRKCGIGSVKGNIGHLMEASGIAGFIKAVLSIKNRKLLPNLHFTEPNPHIDFKDSPFYVNTELKEWEESSWPRRAGVSSFGFGGTNAHIILEERPNFISAVSKNGAQIIPISARTPEALEALASRLGNYLQENPTLSLPDVAYTLQVGRKEWKYRRAYVCCDLQQASSLLLTVGLSSSVLGKEEKSDLYALAESWVSGSSIDWNQLHVGQPRRVPLPPYPFERKKYWVDLPQEQRGVIKQNTNTLPATYSIESIEKRLIAIWQELLGCKEVTRSDNFFDLGGESLLAFQVLSEIKSSFGISLSLHSLYESPTIAQLAFVISQETQSLPSNIIQLKAGKTDSNLFLFHPIDGTIFSYQHLAQQMDFKGSIYAVRAHETTQEVQTIEEIAKSYINEVKKVQKTGPYFFFGASFGGLIAYEMARQLKESGDAVGMLAMLDILNPHYERLNRGSFEDAQTSLIELFEGKEVSTSTLKNSSDQQVSDRILSLVGLDILPREHQQKIAHQIDKHLQALQKYTPKPYDGKILFFEMKERFFRFKDISLSATWQPFVKGGIRVCELEGNHRNMLKAPYSDKLASQLDLCLAGNGVIHE